MKHIEWLSGNSMGMCDLDLCSLCYGPVTVVNTVMNPRVS